MGPIYLAASVRNVGTGLALLHAWSLVQGDARTEPADPAAFHRLSRDLYIAPNDSGFWQGAIRDADDPDRPYVLAAITNRDQLRVDVLYGDQVGGQRTITRFAFIPLDSASGSAP